MIIVDRSFPHPVLAAFKDDVMPNQFDFIVKVSHDGDNYYLDLSFKYLNKTLIDLIESGNVTHSVHVECRRNYYREIFSFQKFSERVSVRATDLVGRVEVSGFVKVQAPIRDYRIEGSHADYGASTFELKCGDVLAVASSFCFEAYVDYDPLRKISSILTIRRSIDDEEGPMQLDMGGDKIVATLSQRDYDRYTELKADPKMGALIANQVVVPALLEAVHEMKGVGDDELSVEMTKRWFRSVSKKLDDLGVKVRSPDVSAIHAVQTLLKLPLRRSLEGIILMNPLEENS